jgi:hypothetical protein
MTATVSPASAQLAIVQADANNKMALMRRDMADLKKTNDEKDRQIAQLGAGLQIQTTKGRLMLGLSTAVTAGSALGGGALDGFLEGKGADKVGPVKFTSLAGLGSAVAGVAVDDVSLAEFLSAVGRGLVAGPLWESGRSWGLTKAAGGAQLAPAQPTTNTAPAKR